MGDISKNFSYKEFESSNVAAINNIDNSIPDITTRNNIRELVTNILQPLRDALGVAINISSGYRCRELNEKVGGVESSQHRRGQAADTYSLKRTPFEIAQKVEQMNLPYDQMILYDDFVHLSHDPAKQKQRKQLLYNKSYTGKKIYE